MKNKRKTKRHKLLMNVKPREKIVIYDIYSRFSVELCAFEEPVGMLAVEFNLPSQLRVARGCLT